VPSAGQDALEVVTFLVGQTGDHPALGSVRSRGCGANGARQHLIASGVVSRSVRVTAAFLREAERVYRNPKLGVPTSLTNQINQFDFSQTLFS
jgi:hypothetical protein